MNKATLLKLKNNPHYKLTRKQQEELARLEAEERKGMVEFGVPPINRNGFDKHDTKLTRLKRE